MTKVLHHYDNTGEEVFSAAHVDGVVDSQGNKLGAIIENELSEPLKKKISGAFVTVKQTNQVTI